MKLVDILARELCLWPTGVAGLRQHENGSLLDEANYAISAFAPCVLADDRVLATVTRAQWQEAREALNTPVKPGAPMPPISEAPSDATHWDQGINCTAGWAKRAGDNWYWWPMNGSPLEPGWRPYRDPATRNFIKIEREWNGEGLPPAGAFCESLWNESRNEWFRAKIFGANEHGQPIFRWEEGPKKYEYQASPLTGFRDKPYFRPIRTPEQIAAEEREKHISDICMIFDRDPSSPTNRNHAARLYDAGYRKVKGGEE